jgi:hypothetical protein
VNYALLRGFTSVELMEKSFVMLVIPIVLPVKVEILQAVPHANWILHKNTLSFNPDARNNVLTGLHQIQIKSARLATLNVALVMDC